MKNFGLKLALFIGIVLMVAFTVLGIKSLQENDLQMFLLNILAFVNCCFANCELFNKLKYSK
jgi:hypothetical protein